MTIGELIKLLEGMPTASEVRVIVVGLGFPLREVSNAGYAVELRTIGTGD
jgi:hypothetical protein